MLRSWVPNLSNIFAKHGLQNTALHRHPMPPVFAKYEWDKSLVAYQEFSQMFLDRRGQGEGDRMRILIAMASEESKAGVAVVRDMVVAIGRTVVAEPVK